MSPHQQSPLAVPAAVVLQILQQLCQQPANVAKADASVTVPGLGIVSVYDKYKHMEVNSKTHSTGGRRCRLSRGTNVGSDPDHGRPVGFAMLWLPLSGEGHFSCQAEHCNPFFYALLAAPVEQHQAAREQFCALPLSRGATEPTDKEKWKHENGIVQFSHIIVFPAQEQKVANGNLSAAAVWSAYAYLVAALLPFRAEGRSKHLSLSVWDAFAHLASCSVGRAGSAKRNVWARHPVTCEGKE